MSLFGSNFPWYNNCSPFSYLSKYVEIIEQNHHYLNFLHCFVIQDHISFWGYCRGPWHGPWRQCLIVYILHTQTISTVNFPLFFYSKSSKFPFWTCTLNLTQLFGSMQKPWKQYPKIFYCFYVCLSVFSLGTIFWNMHRLCKPLEASHINLDQIIVNIL